jgi:phosphomannomutase
VILANDPDADRLAVAELQPDGSWTVFTGNQIGSMLAEWTWRQHAARGGVGAQCFMLSTAVSSKMLQAMARVHGFAFHETLTGFKWLGNRAQELIAQGNTFLFAFEEAIGFMLGDVCFDKDGVRAAAVFAELTNYVYR